MATLLLHAVLAAWLLAVSVAPPRGQVERVLPIWLPPAPPRLPPPPVEPWPSTLDAIEPSVLPILEPASEALFAPTAPDWEGDAREVARAIGGGTARRTFGEMPKAPPGRPKEEYPPSIYDKPLPRVGTTVTTPEGETILWVSDNCYIPLESMSLTMQDFHKARQGIRRCQIGLGKRKPRGDLFDHLKRPPPPEQQEPGCRPAGGTQSCAP